MFLYGMKIFRKKAKHVENKKKLIVKSSRRDEWDENCKI